MNDDENTGARVSYQKLPITAKRALDLARARDRACECPGCHASVMPDQLAEHMSMRCSRERPAPSPAARWLNRTAALNYTTATKLDFWVERGLVRTHDGRYLERDVSIATAWARALEAL